MPRNSRRRDEDEDEEQEDEDFDAADEEFEDEDDTGGRGKKRRSEFIDDAADDDEDEDDEEPGNRKRHKASIFFDEIASDDDDENEEEIDDGEDIIDNEELGEDLNEPEYEPRPFRSMADDQEEDPEEMVRRFEEKYRRTADEHDDLDANAVTQQGLLPTIKDPKLWIVTCRQGREREACMQLLQKAYTMAERDTPLLIKSATCLDHLQGYIYVEAEKESYVLDAIRGLRTMMISKGAKLVPLNEMVDAISPNIKAQAEMGRDSWVRVKGGPYKDDLAKVVTVDFAAGKAIVKIVPRLDYAQMKEDRGLPFGGATKRRIVRPPPKPFSFSEAYGSGLKVERRIIDNEEFRVIGNMRFKDGYLYKQFNLKGLIRLDTMPSLDELQRFNAASQADKDQDRDDQDRADELSELVKALPTDGLSTTTHFAKGDKVRAVAGDLLNLEGVVESIRDDGKIMVRPDHKDMGEAFEFDPTELRKLFKVGDHVKVLAGEHSGETGMVLQVLDNVCVVMSDSTRQEVRVFARYLTESKDIQVGVDVLGDYLLHDLVQLDEQTAGVIITIEKDAARVLTSASTTERQDVRVVRASEIRRKLRQGLGTQDSVGGQVSPNDNVTIIEGAMKGRQAKVQYVFKGLVFLKSRDFHDNGGFLAIRARSTRGRGSKPGQGSMLNRMLATPSHPSRSPAAHMNVLRSPGHYSSSVLASPGRNSEPPGFGDGPGRGRGGFRAPMGGRGGHGVFSGRSHHGRQTSELIGKMISVAKGPYRGYKGRVKHETATHVQLELDAICRVVTVPKDQLPSMSGGPGRGYPGRGPGPSPRPHLNARTPLHPSQTPNYSGAATPLHPSMTPLHPSMTPLHPSMTPHHASTPGMDWQANASTPMEDGGGPASAPTPYQNMYTPAATFDGAADTPAFTPADMGTPHADTPGMAYTPGVGTAQTPALAPTPADGSTPSTYDGGYTPMSTNTPGLAQTPGMAAYTPALTPGLTPALTPADGGYAEPAMTPADVGAPDYQHWEGVLVVLEADGADKRTGVVKSVSPDGTCVVDVGTLKDTTLEREGEETVLASTLALVQPNKKNRVKVLNGDDVGHTGEMILLDGNDGIVKLDGEGVDLKIYEIGFLGKMVTVN